MSPNTHPRIPTVQAIRMRPNHYGGVNPAITYDPPNPSRTAPPSKWQRVSKSLRNLTRDAVDLLTGARCIRGKKGARGPTLGALGWTVHQGPSTSSMSLATPIIGGERRGDSWGDVGGGGGGGASWSWLVVPSPYRGVSDSDVEGLSFAGFDGDWYEEGKAEEVVLDAEVVRQMVAIARLEHDLGSQLFREASGAVTLTMDASRRDLRVAGARESDGDWDSVNGTFGRDVEGDFFLDGSDLPSPVGGFWNRF